MEMGLKGEIPMAPLCRTPKEADRVLAVMADEGLVLGEDNLDAYVMCELPSNVTGLDAFAEPSASMAYSAPSGPML